MNKVGGSLGILAAAGLAFSLFSTGVCSCLTVAQQATFGSWPDLDERESAQRLAKRYPPGTPAAEVPTRLRVRYEKYCVDDKRNSAVRCVLPHEANSWRSVTAELTLAFDAEQKLRSARAERQVKYAWQ